MPEIITNSQDNLQVQKYDNTNAIHFYDVDPVSGKRTHIGEDQMLRDRGHDPNTRLSGEPLVGGGVEPTPAPPVEASPAGPEQGAVVAALQQQFEAFAGLVKQLIDQNVQQIEQLTNNINQLIQQLAQQNANFLQQNANIVLLLQQLVTNQQQGQPAPDSASPTPEEIAAEAAKKAAEDKAAAETAAKEAAEKEAQEREAAIAAALEKIKREDEEKAAAAKKEAAEKRSAKLGAAADAVEEARKALARFALRRESRAGDYLTPSALIGRSQEDRRGYQEAMDAWKQAVAKYQDLRYDALMIEHEGDETKVTAVLKAELIAENNDFIELKYKLNEERQKELTSTEDKNFLGKLNAKKNQFAIWYSKQKTWKKWATGMVAGTAVGFAVSATAGVGLAALAAGAATRYSFGLLGNKGSLINVSTKAKAAELKQVEKHYKSLLNLSTDHLLDQLHGETAADFAGKRIGKETLRHMNKNRLGRVMMLGGAALTALGLLGVDFIPNIPHPHLPKFFGGIFGRGNHPGSGALGPDSNSGNVPVQTTGGGNVLTQTTGGGPGYPGGPIPNLSPSELKLDTIHSQDMHGFVMGTKHLLEGQGIGVQGLTDEKARLIGEYMQNNHWNLVEGMQNNGSGGLEQHVVDALSWKSGINNPSHAQAWTSKEELAKFMQVAHDRFGVEFSSAGVNKKE